MKIFSIGLVIVLIIACNVDPEPRARFNATGKVTSVPVQLPGRLTRCDKRFELTGFLGLGQGKYITTISAVNDGDEPGRRLHPRRRAGNFCLGW